MSGSFQSDVEALYDLAIRDLALAKGALCLEQSDWTGAELEKITRRFAQEMIHQRFLDTASNAPAPDVGTIERHMKWFADESRR